MAMNETQGAKAVSIWNALKAGWPDRYLDRSRAKPVIEAMLGAVSHLSPEAVAHACQEFAQGALDRDHSFPFTGAELAARGRIWQSAIERRDEDEPELHSGLMVVDFGRGKVDMRGLTVAEQDRILAAKGVTPDGRNLAYLPAAEIRKALSGDLITAPVPMAPKMQRVTG